MARPRSHLRNAPIVEAMIDFRVLRQDQISPTIFEDLKGSIGERYGEKSAMYSFETRFGIDKEGRFIDSAPVQAVVGWMYRAGTELAQFRADGFTFSKIEPYTRWEEVFGEALRLWQVYIDVAQPNQVSRVAVRYINRMRLSSVTDLRRYIEVSPQLPAPIPQAIREFLSRVYVDDDSRNASAVIVQAIEPRVDATAISLLLDIDAFREISVAATDPELPSFFEQLRGLKNDIFFASITETTAEMYE